MCTRPLEAESRSWSCRELESGLLLGSQNSEVQNEQLNLTDSKLETDLSGKSQSGEVEDMESNGVVLNDSDLGHAGMVNSQKVRR